MSNSAAQNWTIYEANVQQYRVLSATVQSFLLTIGSILFTSTPSAPGFLLWMLFLMGVFHVLLIWVPVVYARHKVIDYYKFQHESKLTPEKIAALTKECDEKSYINDAEKRATVNRDYFERPGLTVWRLTRIKLDLIVPAAYVLVWIGLALWKKPWSLPFWS